MFFLIYLQVRSKCHHTFRTCKWNDQVFDCCEYFTELDTELGLCYGINSVQSRYSILKNNCCTRVLRINFFFRNNHKKYPMISNRKNGPGNLYIEVYGFVNVSSI